MVYSKYFSFETGPASPKTTAIGLTFTASLLLAFGIFTAQLAYTLDKTGLRVQGEVIGFVESRDNMQSAVFQFSDERGQVRTSRDSLSSSRTAYVIGDKVALVYDKDDPNSVRKDTTFRLYFAPMCLGLMSLLIDSEIPNASIGVFLVVAGSILLIVAWALLRHARFLRSLE